MAQRCIIGNEIIKREPPYLKGPDGQYVKYCGGSHCLNAAAAEAVRPEEDAEYAKVDERHRAAYAEATVKLHELEQERREADPLYQQREEARLAEEEEARVRLARERAGRVPIEPDVLKRQDAAEKEERAAIKRERTEAKRARAHPNARPEGTPVAAEPLPPPTTTIPV